MNMESVELRWNQGTLEYRSLIIHESENHFDNGSCSTQLHINWSQRYTEWKAVPSKETK